MDWDAILMAVNSDPTKPLNEGGVKIVKSVQRGTFYGADLSASVKISINSVDPDKCEVVLDGCAVTNNDMDYIPTPAMLVSIAENIVTIKPIHYVAKSYNRALQGSWQVIEYY